MTRTEAVVNALPSPPRIEELPDAPSLAALVPRVPSPYLAWLDSASVRDPASRYSILAADPAIVFAQWGESWEAQTREGIQRGRRGGWQRFRSLWRAASHRLVPPLDAKVPFAGGWIGYFGYELGSQFDAWPPRRTDALELPDCWLGLYREALVEDTACGTLWHVAAPGTKTSALRRALEASSKGARSTQSRVGKPRSNFTRTGYLAAVRTAKEEIRQGEIYQVNLSQRFTAPYQGDGLALYARLRELNPAPFGAYLRFPGLELASVSPERFLRIEGRRVETWPIKGTRPRGSTDAEDLALVWELLDSPKDRAENTMIVDLERNDLGRVCHFDSIRVAALCRLRTHPTVHHLESRVRGELRAGVGPLELLQATFPGGSITGAPKLRAIEIIDRLEPTPRGPYTGAIGYLGLDGRMDSSIVIRTFIITPGEAHFQVGGGIVADSSPQAEYEETLDKGLSLFRALGVPRPGSSREEALA